MEFLLASQRFSLEFARQALIAYTGSTFPVATFEAALDVIEGVLDRIPESLIKECTEPQL
jgi:hypothetical protein